MDELEVMKRLKDYPRNTFILVHIMDELRKVETSRQCATLLFCSIICDGKIGMTFEMIISDFHIPTSE